MYLSLFTLLVEALVTLLTIGLLGLRRRSIKFFHVYFCSPAILQHELALGRHAFAENALQLAAKRRGQPLSPVQNAE